MQYECDIKNVEQQAVLSLHRVRQGFVKARTATVNAMRGPLYEFGVVCRWQAGGTEGAGCAPSKDRCTGDCDDAHLTRSSLHRCLRRHGINQLPEA